MLKLIKYLSIFLLAIAVIGCENGDGGMEGQEEDMEEGIETGMEQYWMEQRDEFVFLAEESLDEWEQTLDQYDDRAAVSEVESEIENIREKLSELEQAEREEWEEMRNDIASDLNNLRHQIEDLE